MNTLRGLLKKVSLDVIRQRIQSHDLFIRRRSLEIFSRAAGLVTQPKFVILIVNYAVLVLRAISKTKNWKQHRRMKMSQPA